MLRSRFLAFLVAAAASGWARPALATGGLDLDDGPFAPATPVPDPYRMPDPEVEPQRVDPNVMVRVRVGDDEQTRYRGSLAQSGEARINILPLEDYLLGVLPLEMPSAWPAEALAAQAIVARTYALRKCRPNKAYDLVAGTADQMYGGLSVEVPVASQAVLGTSGKVITYNGQLADVAYMSCCGGHTEDAQRLWGSSLPYLRGVADPYCAASPQTVWTLELTWETLGRPFHFDTDAPLDRVELLGPPGARPVTLRCVSGGTAQDIDVLALHRAFARQMHSSYLRSAQVENSDEGEDDAGNRKVVLNGAGRGHGVGFCQWGARGMALSGASAAQIVAFYFPGTAVDQRSSIS